MENCKIKVFIIDDNLPFCDALQFWFDMHDDIDAKIYNEAIHFLNEKGHTENSGFLLMDLFMPGIDGIALLKELKMRGNNLYTIVISGHADQATAAKVKALGADEFLSKPFNISTLLDRIRLINPN